MDTSKISNVLVFKEGYYYLSEEVQLYNDDGSTVGQKTTAGAHSPG